MQWAQNQQHKAINQINKTDWISTNQYHCNRHS